MLAEDAADGGANKFPRDSVRALELAFVLEFELAGYGRECGINVRHARKGILFADAGGALLGVADDALQRGDGQALAYAGAAVYALVVTRLESNFLYDLAQVRGHFNLAPRVARDPGFLLGDGHSFVEGRWVMRANLRADAILQRSDDFAASGVVLRIGGKYEEDVEGQAQWVAVNLNVACLQEV